MSPGFGLFGRQRPDYDAVFLLESRLWAFELESGVSVSADDLGLLRTWYNHLRPHQNPDGLTPAESWNRKQTDRRRRPVWFSQWDGLLSEYYWPG